MPQLLRSPLWCDAALVPQWAHSSQYVILYRTGNTVVYRNSVLYGSYSSYMCWHRALLLYEAVR